MSKRIATYQISDRNPVEPEDDSSGSENEEPNFASERQIRQRKISRPKQRTVSGNNPAPSLSNLFAGLPTNPFAFAPTSTASNDHELKMRGLNKCFVESAQKLLEKSPAADFSRLFQQYQKHLASFAVDLKAKEVPFKASDMKPVVPEFKSANMDQYLVEKRPVVLSEEKIATAPTTLFGSNHIDTTSEEKVSEKPAKVEVEDSFLKNLPNVIDEKVEAPSRDIEKPNFSFNAPKVENSGNSFSFNVPKVENSGNSFRFTAPQAEKTVASSEPASEAPKLFSFQSTSSNNESSPMKFTFPSSTASKEIPSFKSFSFEPKKEEVNFSSSNANSNNNFGFKPFSFGSSNDSKSNNDSSIVGESSTPKFSFGTSSLPTFSFGATTNNPSSGFSFSLPTVQSTAAATGSGDEEGADEIPAEEAESFTLTRTNSEQLKTGAGEENETCQHEERCKVFMMDSTGSSGWIDLGVGIFKINRYNDESGKSRILCRAEGSGKVILNTFVTVPGMDVSAMEGKKEVALLAFGPDGKPTKYLIRVKTLDQAVALKNALASEIDYVKSNK